MKKLIGDLEFLLKHYNDQMKVQVEAKSYVQAGVTQTKIGEVEYILLMIQTNNYAD